jgi:hypothetical protein
MQVFFSVKREKKRRKNCFAEVASSKHLEQQSGEGPGKYACGTIS